MGIDLLLFNKLVKHRGNKRLLSLGYPDLLVNEAQIKAACGHLNFSHDPKEKALAAWHGWNGPIFSTHEVLCDLGYEPTYLDCYAFNGREYVFDLNAHLSTKNTTELGQFDLICDFGTLEHVFSLPTALSNISLLSKPGTVILHSNPLNKPNHGFYSFSPTFYKDFWEANGGQVEDIYIYSTKNLRAIEGAILDQSQYTGRFKVPEEMNIFAEVLIKGPILAPVVMPIQTKYKEKAVE